MDFRIGHGYDVHTLADGLPLVLGGVEIAHTKGCVAHSDGDVAIHALCDALLGAAALGDIGLHFPDTSADFKGIDSKILLRRVAELLRRVRELHSLRAAAMSMNMAYSKAWRIIRTAETVFGCKLLSSTIGGAHGVSTAPPPWRPPVVLSSSGKPRAPSQSRRIRQALE